MFISWLVINPENLESAIRTEGFDICLDLRAPVKFSSSFWHNIQAIPIKKKLSLLFSGRSEANGSYQYPSDDLIPLFFQPGFYQVTQKPVVFAQRPMAVCNSLLMDMEIHLKKQGFDGIKILEIPGDQKQPDAFSFCFTQITDCNRLLNNWLDQACQSERLFPINLLFNNIEIDQADTLYKQFETQLRNLVTAKQYRIAEKLLLFQQEKEELKDRILKAEVNEQNHRLYLEFQKKDLARTLKWYHYEHEILPLWYKQFGHIIKVITRKRTFRSLFSDKVKKYLD